MDSSAASVVFQVVFLLSAAIAGILALTWLITNVQFYVQSKRLASGEAQRHDMEPLMLPYLIPWLGSSIGFLTEQASFWANMRWVALSKS
jgi:hypothetical protein